jgi:hypothetical protein
MKKLLYQWIRCEEELSINWKFHMLFVSDEIVDATLK